MQLAYYIPCASCLGRNTWHAPNLGFLSGRVLRAFIRELRSKRQLQHPIRRLEQPGSLSAHWPARSDARAHPNHANIRQSSLQVGRFLIGADEADCAWPKLQEVGLYLTSCNCCSRWPHFQLTAESESEAIDLRSQIWRPLKIFKQNQTFPQLSQVSCCQKKCKM